jgi:hypothetical protein
MIARFCPCSEELRRLEVGPIGPHLKGFADLISQQGYCRANGWLKVRLASALSRWLHRRHIVLTQLNEALTTAFLNARWKRVPGRAGERATMTLLLRHLRQAEVIAPPLPVAAGSDLDLIALDYESFLLRERSLASSSTEVYLGVTRRFLSYCFPRGSIYLAKLRAKDISDFGWGQTRDLDFVRSAPVGGGDIVRQADSILPLTLTRNAEPRSARSASFTSAGKHLVNLFA